MLELGFSLRPINLSSPENERPAVNWKSYNMESFLIKGGVPLHGEVTISGSKNAALPIMAATLLTDEPSVIRRVPELSDTRFMTQILNSLGATATLCLLYTSPGR